MVKHPVPYLRIISNCANRYMVANCPMDNSPFSGVNLFWAHCTTTIIIGGNFEKVVESQITHQKSGKFRELYVHSMYVPSNSILCGFIISVQSFMSFSVKLIQNTKNHNSQFEDIVKPIYSTKWSFQFTEIL